MHDVVKFFRSNPQALALLVICVILGVGTFVAVVVSLLSSGSTTTSGEPSGAIGLLQVMIG